MSNPSKQGSFVIPHPATWGVQGWLVALSCLVVALAPWAFLFLIVYAVMQTP